jgi:hypothetical protein
MTVFDIIRFPNINIYHKSDLDKLPRELVEQWILEITKDVDYPFALDIKDPRNSFSGIAYNTAILRARAGYSTGKTQSFMMKMYREQFTNLLMKMLGEYDSPI